jgi:hypothetical protein
VAFTPKKNIRGGERERRGEGEEGRGKRRGVKFKNHTHSVTDAENVHS